MQFVRTYGPLYLVAFGLAVTSTAYAFSRPSTAPLLQILIWILTASSLALWVRDDARARGCTPCFEFDSFIFFTWWLSIPGYLIVTRGWRGLLVAVTAVLLFLVTAIACAIVVTFFLLLVGALVGA